MENKVQQIYSKNLATINETDNVFEADLIMKNRNIRHLPVTDGDGYLVGILSKSDFIALNRLSIDLRSVKVKELMSTPVKTFSKTATVRSVAQLFINKKINSGLVMDDQEIIGIVTTEDLLRLLVEKEELEVENSTLDLAALAGEGWISSTSLR